MLLQVDTLRAGLVGKTRDVFARRYCNRRLIPVGKQGEARLKNDNNGLSHSKELHLLLKQVSFSALGQSNVGG